MVEILNLFPVVFLLVLPVGVGVFVVNVSFVSRYYQTIAENGNSNGNSRSHGQLFDFMDTLV